MTQFSNGYRILTPNEVKWFSDVQLKQCAVTFRNIADIEEYVINRCFGRDFYDYLMEHLIDRRQEPCWWDATKSYEKDDIVRHDAGDGVKYYRNVAPMVVLGDATQLDVVGDTDTCEVILGFDADDSELTDPAVWEEILYEQIPLASIQPWDKKTEYCNGQRATYGGIYYEAIQDTSAGTTPSDEAYWMRLDRFDDPVLEDFYCRYLVHWLAFNVWYHKIPFIRGQDENATIQFRFVDYQIAKEALQSLRQEIQNHLYMIWSNMKARFPDYFPPEKTNFCCGCQCDDPTGIDCGQEALRKFAFRVA